MIWRVLFFFSLCVYHCSCTKPVPFISPSPSRSSLQTASGIVLWVRANLLTFPCLLVVFVGSMAASVLLVFHSFLMFSGQTTWEMASRFKISYLRDLEPAINPFDQGLCRNAAHFICFPADWEHVYMSAVQHVKTSA